MKIGIVKPDYKISGGFEVVVNRLKLELEQMGHQVQMVYIDATDQSINEIPYNLTNEMFHKNPDFFRYINHFWKYLKMDLNRFDCVISTQPPSFAIQHPRHISLFYHHMKVYYDMSNLIQEVGLQQPYHRKAVEVIREIDTKSLSKVSTILAGSKTIQNRLAEFNGLSSNVDVIYAGIDPEIYHYDGELSYVNPVVVGRHEFPKRPELFVAAMKLVANETGVIVGAGGRTDDLKKIDQLLTMAAKEQISIPNDVIWKQMSNGHFHKEYKDLGQLAKKKNYPSNIRFTGRVSKEDLFKEYSKALCVVCPAYQEDYGLTAIEAMSFKKPIIACKDGGGYAELIEDGINGFLVEPTSEAIAEAILKFSQDKTLAVRMGNAAYETSRKYTWNNTISKLNEHLIF
ncbi:Glycosyltransferase involved in cell wall bisynthesis [Paenibacillus algorifonticola]|uniref:Glycosyltransferase involved in cell wall bisynthesis n=1 Tax=Paenibacillus algorifonticola TaxID=684063 RepID=A0A1I2E0K3_9BACL|nr:glycosyltransferase family 4 protein [Paenibacillus algorifonticola]SFE86219.1 Glycosyltransferase involved in cell wall bisynthesis [Paenibacillus algorifonticola]